MRATIIVPTVRKSSPTLDCLEEFSLEDVEIVEQRDPRSLNHARNEGVKAATSENILVLDDDLTFTEAWLSQRITDAERSKDRRTIWGARGTGILDDMNWSDANFTPILGRVMVFNQAAWRESGGFPSRRHHGGDTVFALRAAQAGWTVEALPHEFEHHDTVDEYSFGENLRWLWTLTRTAPGLLVPRLPKIALTGLETRLGRR